MNVLLFTFAQANFQLTMVREPGHISLFNMPLVETEDFSADGLKQDKFEASVKMSTYLVAFIVCDFTYIQNKTSRGTIVSRWSLLRPDIFAVCFIDKSMCFF